MLDGLVVANLVYYKAYNLENTLKAVAIIGAGWLAYLLIVRRVALKLPRMFEKFEDLLGVMSLISILLFWVALRH